MTFFSFLGYVMHLKNSLLTPEHRLIITTPSYDTIIQFNCWKKKFWSIFCNTSGKLWLKMRRMSIIWHVLHFFDFSLRLTSRMDLIQHALDTPDLVDYFSYPHHDQKVHKKVFRGSWRQKLHSKVMKVRNFEMLIWPWKMKIWLENSFLMVSEAAACLSFRLPHLFDHILW